MSTSKERGSAGNGRKRSEPKTKPTPSSRAATSESSSSRPTAVADAGFAEVRFLTVAEVASVMRVSKMTVYRLVHSGELPAVRVGRSFRVHAKAVHDYLETSYFDAG